MLYINPQSEYPRHAGDIQLIDPTWEIGQPLPEGWILVEPTEPPVLTGDKVLQELAPQEVDGTFTQVWSLRDMTEQEIALRDAPLTARQKLRDYGLSDLEINALSRGLV